ncbi:Uncharacterised protein [BD1-7 clade bacterium]|uniref:Uncharacterized protein n=1 Tax=BD1-7 clade bacterium TaxID=2029982 RepID=A0A5S9PLZ5_9GAMM|nr:Uncharacterised protein [BD1-7 clade bacterium]
MSSSNQSITSKRYFLAVVFLSLCGTLILLFSAWIIDPLGILQEHRGFPSLCANGVKVDPDDSVSRLLPLTTEFVDDVIIGTSKIKEGITQKIWQSLMSTQSINLYMSGASVNDVHSILIPLMKNKNPHRIWLGLDYGMFVSPTKKRSHSTPSYSQQSEYIVYKHGIFSTKAMNATAKILFSGKTCNSIIRNSAGFLINEPERHISDTDLDQQALAYERLFVSDKFHNREYYQISIDQFSEILETANRTNISINIFINPSHSKYLDALDKAGHAENYIHWKQSISEIVNELSKDGLKLKLIDFTDMIERESLPCDPLTSCPFYDITHFHPSIGRRMLSKFIGN